MRLATAALAAAALLAPAAARPQSEAQLPTVVLLATGGTIAMKIDPVKNAPVPAISGEDLVSIVGM
jgi:L-asparaginase